MKRIFYFLVLFTLLLISCKKDENQINNVGDLEGYIKNEYGQPIEKAKIEVKSLLTYSEYNGKYSFKDLPVNEYKVTVSKETYLAKIQNIKIIENEINILDFILEAGESSLIISDSIINVNASAGNTVIEIIANIEWIVENSCDWLTCSKESGAGTDKIKIVWSENQKLIGRSDTLYLRSGDISKSIIINQSGQLKLIKYEVIIGNGAKEIEDSILLIFNKSITVDFINVLQMSCSLEMDYTIVENNHGIKSSFPCAGLGGFYTVIFSVSDNEGNTLKQSIGIPFYSEILELEGEIVDYCLNEDNKNCWVATKNPNKIFLVSIDSLLIIKIFELNFTPRILNINPYNKYLYVLGGDPSIYLHDNHIYVIDPSNGSVVKTLIIEPAIDDHPQAPSIYPHSIGFTSTGYGIILLTDENESSRKYRIIDSSLDDTLYQHNQGYELDGAYLYLEKVHINFDKSKILLTEAWNGNGIVFLDGISHKFDRLLVKPLGRRQFIVPNKKNDKIYIGNLFEQFVIDLSGYISKISEIYNVYKASADFDYRNNQENIIYYCKENYLSLLDYNEEKTLMWQILISDLMNITSTTDGKYILAYYINYYNEPNSRLYNFNTDFFYRHLY
jgi:hypothetical protein